MRARDDPGEQRRLTFSEEIRRMLRDLLETVGTRNQGLTAAKGQSQRFSFTADVALL